MNMIYLAGPITAPTKERIEHNCWFALEVATELIARGYQVYVPHWSGLIEQAWTDPRLSHERWIETDLRWLRMCDSIVLLPGWRKSKGACLEADAAWRYGLKYFEWIDGEVLPLNPHTITQQVEADRAQL